MNRHYVYEMIDPRDNSVFYVGKGQDNRANAHLNEYQKLLNDGNDLIHPKHQKIKEIKNAGKEPIVIVIGRYTSEAQALAVEATLINWVYGHSNLDNIARGHGFENIRIKGQLDVNRELDPPVPGDGGAAKMRHEYLTHAGTIKSVDYIREELNQRGFAVYDYDSEQYDNRYFPTVANGEYGFICHVAGIDFIIKSRENNLFNIGLANTPSTNANIENLRSYSPSLEVRDANNTIVNGLPRFRGIKYPRKIPIDDFETFYEWFEPIVNHLNKQA